MLSNAEAVSFTEVANRFRFLDSRNFTSGGSLGSFARTWRQMPKGVFPYELYQTISQAKQASEWPPIEKFYSHIKRNQVTNVEAKLEESFKYLKEKLGLSKTAFITKFNSEQCTSSRWRWLFQN